MMSEAELTARIIGRAQDLELRAFHSQDPRIDIGPGFPDTVIAGPNGLLVSEIKLPHGVWSEDQRAWRNMLRLAQGAPVPLRYEIWGPADWESGQIEQRLLGIC